MTTPVPVRARHAVDLDCVYRGTVRSFDEQAGLGTVVLTIDGQDCAVGFHCTAIADGTRSINVGALVTAGLVTGRCGTVEATALTGAGD